MVAFVSTATTASVGAMGAGIKTMQRLIKQYKQGFKALYILVFICLQSLLQYV